MLTADKAPAVEKHVADLRKYVSSKLNEITTIASEDNQTVAAAIAGKIAEQVVKALERLTEAENLIKNLTLTHEKAKEIFQSLAKILTDTQGLVKDDVAKLSPSAAQTIRDTFTGAYAEAKKGAEALYALLA